MTDVNDKAGKRLLKSKTCEERYIKVNQTFYDYRVKNQPACSGCRAVPWINIKGQWLKKAGFDINTPVKVRVMDGCLVLTAQQDNNQ